MDKLVNSRVGNDLIRHLFDIPEMISEESVADTLQEVETTAISTERCESLWSGSEIDDRFSYLLLQWQEKCLPGGLSMNFHW